jgi:HlyD family secretion protein
MLRTILRKGLRWTIALLVVAGGGFAYLSWQQQPTKAQYISAAVTRGTVARTINTTGTVNPEVTIEIGTYVSGRIQAVFCDFNTQVKAGQICAKLDPRPYQVVVEKETANLASARAQLRKDQAALGYAKTNYERDLRLNRQGIVSQDALDKDKAAYDEASAQVGLDEAEIQQHEAALRAAQVNLDFTDIVSPVDGVVVSRNINAGQTVAASLQSPVLFLIAKDLTRMQVDNNVSESDIGTAKVGQKATFTVDAYPNATFVGKVTQVRQAPITVQNVVTYDVVVGVENTESRLFPGMTANTRIIIDERENVVRVPALALRYSPERAAATAAGGSGRPEARAQAADGPRERGGRGERARSTRVWVERDGEAVPIDVVTGLEDGTFVEIVSGELQAGDRVITNEIPPDSARGGLPRLRPRF